jgi:L-lactate dehydrogenase complex protein LldG
MTTSRDRILANIRAGLATTRPDLERIAASAEHTPPPFVHPPADDLTTQFITELTRLEGRAHRCATDQEALTVVRDILQEQSVNTVIAWELEQIGLVGLAELLNALGVNVADSRIAQAGAARADQLQHLDPVPVCISGAVCAIAESGSLLLLSDQGRGRLASLLAPVHIAVLRVSQLVRGLGEALSTVQATYGSNPFVQHSNLTIISGPSRTADIELTLTLGVHGPRELHVILIEAEAPAEAAMPEVPTEEATTEEATTPEHKLPAEEPAAPALAQAVPEAPAEEVAPEVSEPQPGEPTTPEHKLPAEEALPEVPEPQPEQPSPAEAEPTPPPQRRQRQTRRKGRQTAAQEPEPGQKQPETSETEEPPQGRRTRRKGRQTSAHESESAEGQPTTGAKQPSEGRQTRRKGRQTTAQKSTSPQETPSPGGEAAKTAPEERQPTAEKERQPTRKGRQTRSKGRQPKESDQQSAAADQQSGEEQSQPKPKGRRTKGRKVE